MGKHCCVKGCNHFEGQRINKTVRFFLFPKDPKFIDAWVKACGYSSIKKIKYNLKSVCSEHFTDEDYTNNKFSVDHERARNRLKKDAVPSRNLPISYHLPIDCDKNYGKKKTINYERLLPLDILVEKTKDSKDEDSSTAAEDEIGTINDELSEVDFDEISDPIDSKIPNASQFLNLCHVCGKNNDDENKFVLIHKHEKKILQTLKKCFSIVIPKFDDPYWKICIICKAYIQSLSTFCVHVERVQRMIEVIHDLTMENIKFEMDEVRKSFRIFAPRMELYLIENLDESINYQQDIKEEGYENNIKESENFNIQKNGRNPSSESSEKDFDFNINEEKLLDIKVELNNDCKELSNDVMNLENEIIVYDTIEPSNVENLVDLNFNIDKSDDSQIEFLLEEDINSNTNETDINDFSDDNKKKVFEENPIKKKRKKGEPSKTAQKYPHATKRYECEICFQKCYGARNFFKHKMHVHNIVPPEKKLNQEEARKNVKYCEICDRTFYHEYILTTHYETCHNIKRELTCDYCGEKFNTTIKLNHHLRKHLPKEELLKISEFECSYCSKKFLNKHSLIIHIKGNHEIVKDYICEKCGKSFTCASYLSAHRRHEHIENPTACTVCKEMFKNYSVMKCHLHTVHGNNRRYLSQKYGRHLGEKPFACPCCQKRCRTSKALNIHMIKHTNLKPFKCRICGKDFTSPSNCKKHVKVIHHVKATNDCYIGETPSIEEIESLIGVKDITKVEDTDDNDFEVIEFQINDESIIDCIVEETIDTA